MLLNRKRRKSEALCTAPKIALLGAGCACLHGDGERSPLGATGVLWWWERTYSNVHAHTHTHTHKKKDLIFATVACWDDRSFSCGKTEVWYFCCIFIRKANSVRNNKSKSLKSQWFLSHFIQYQPFSCVASQLSKPTGYLRKKRQNCKATPNPFPWKKEGTVSAFKMQSILSLALDIMFL